MVQVVDKRNRVVQRRFILAGLSATFLLIIISILIVFYPFASSVKENYFKGENPVIYKGKQAGNAVIEGNSVYVPLNFMTKLDETIFFDNKSNSLIITTSDKVVQMPTDSLTYFVNQNPVQLQVPPLKAKDGSLYVALDPILSFYPIQYEIIEGTNAVWINRDGEQLQSGKITPKDINKEKLRLRKSPSLQSSYTAQLKNNETIFIEGEKEDYYFIRRKDGVAGYMEKELIQHGDSTKISIKHAQNSITLPKIKGPIHLTWEAVYTKNPDPGTLPEMPGVNVVSPTWFHLSSSDGNVKNMGSPEYVQWAKQRGYQIWGLFSNSFDPVMTHEAFKDYETRQKIIRQLLHYSEMFHLDGINLDIENVNKEDGPLVTQFVREATPYFHQAGLIVSMDITFMSSSGNWSAFYEREKLAEVVDYLIVMAYDEHWGTSQVAGSVSSLPWVEENLAELLKVVPNERLILGVPLFARLWKEQQAQDGSMQVTSEAMAMEKAKKWLSDNKIKPVYDTESGQNYAELFVENENVTYKIWLEDELSLQKRAELAQVYELAGIATWSRYFADQSAWVALQVPDGSTVTKK
ncbi:glycosyl hydrolase family 18 protein [Bacillus sp. T33-2]|uniref:glycosyl hydrolase family 18 protein n=1 Tax=Bacillus sp. T33-2 TaxID=2054168 RepID=UPI000C775909|nr:glycosyl hydrolase family 18 protein [Bacillus sp. T33-2]PLR95264.1 peptidoglycan hydrolase [Bacillus sp. T33-2]